MARRPNWQSVSRPSCCILIASHNSSLHEEASELLHTHLRPHVVKLLKDLEDLESNEQVSNDSHIDQWQKKHDEVETAIEFEEQYSKIFSTG